MIFFNNNFAPVRIFSLGIQSIFSNPKAALYSLKSGQLESDQIKQLKNENSDLKKKIIEYESIKRDNEALRSQFETAAADEYKIMPAKIIGFLGTYSAPASFILDQGVQNGIKSGMAVVMQNNLVGKINKVDQLTSQVTLVTDPDFSALAKTSDGKASGIAKGNEDFILLDRVSINDTLSKGILLLSTGDINGQGVGMPPDFVIGKIVSVNRSPSLPLQTAKVQSELNFNRLETVFIITGIK